MYIYIYIYIYIYATLAHGTSMGAPPAADHQLNRYSNELPKGPIYIIIGYVLYFKQL